MCIILNLMQMMLVIMLSDNYAPAQMNDVCLKDMTLNNPTDFGTQQNACVYSIPSNDETDEGSSKFKAGVEDCMTNPLKLCMRVSRPPREFVEYACFQLGTNVK